MRASGGGIREHAVYPDGLRHPHFRLDRILQATVLNIRDDSDDLKPRFRELVWELFELGDMYTLSHRIVVTEIFVHERLIYERQLALPFYFGFREWAPIDQ